MLPSGITLMDGVALNHKYPKTFEIPSLSAKHNVDVGDIVKLGFEDGNLSGERMWVKVTKIFRTSYSNAKFVGILDNDPIVYTDMQLGQEIDFSSEHILAID